MFQHGIFPKLKFLAKNTSAGIAKRKQFADLRTIEDGGKRKHDADGFEDFDRGTVPKRKRTKSMSGFLAGMMKIGRLTGPEVAECANAICALVASSGGQLGLDIMPSELKTKCHFALAERLGVTFGGYTREAFPPVKSEIQLRTPCCLVAIATLSLYCLLSTCYTHPLAMVFNCSISLGFTLLFDVGVGH